MLPLALAAALVKRDCVCGHAFGHHHPSLFTGGRRCWKRVGFLWRRRCLCVAYREVGS